jgi:diguanylate cyclase (GGDEF)-like protein
MSEVDRLKDQNLKLKATLKNLTDAYTSLEKMNKNLSENIFVDENTRLYNYRYLNIRLDEEMKRAKRYNQFLSLVLVSVSSLREDSDPEGKGNFSFMRKLGEFIKANLRDTDILSLYDNDVLALILPETSIEGAVCLSERLKDHVLFAFSDAEMGTATQKTSYVSIGITSYPTDARVIDELIEHASHMLECSRGSENNTIYCSIMN